MMHRALWYPLLMKATTLWYESGENPLVFCYLIGWGIFVMWARTPAPTANSARLETACCNPSCTFSTRSIVPRALEN